MFILSLLAITSFTQATCPIKDSAGSCYQNNWVPPNYSEQDIKNLQGKRCLNLEEVAEQVGFKNEKVNPYPGKLGYDTIIRGGPNWKGEQINCYVHYPFDGDDSRYRLESWTRAQADQANAKGPQPRAFLTHAGQCGVCSDLENLAAYIKNPDLTTPFKFCGLLPGDIGFNCAMQRSGLVGRCQEIWYFNVLQDKKMARQGGCLGVCLVNLDADANDPGNFPFLGGNQCNCGNTINGGRACYPEAFEVGSKFKLNACLACDECRAGPIFQKIAARSRRNSGLNSEIERPPNQFAQITHFYGRRTGSKTFIFAEENITENATMIAGIVGGIFGSLGLLFVVVRRRRYSKSTTSNEKTEIIIDDSMMSAENPVFESEKNSKKMVV